MNLLVLANILLKLYVFYVIFIYNSLLRNEMICFKSTAVEIKNASIIFVKLVQRPAFVERFKILRVKNI